jgi:hypothetical protein
MATHAKPLLCDSAIARALPLVGFKFKQTMASLAIEVDALRVTVHVFVPGAAVVF